MAKSQRSIGSPRFSVRGGSGSSGLDYKLYAVTYHGSGLDAIHDEFIQCVKSGLRRRVFAVDLNAEIEQLTKKENSQPVDLVEIAINAIERCRREYINVTKAIGEEQRFDLTKHWLDHMNTASLVEPKNGRKSDSKGAKGGKSVTSAKATPESSKLKRSKESSIQTSVPPFEPPDCAKMLPLEHNKVGRPEKLSKKKYIIDEPLNSKLFIILIGDFDNTFYTGLLRLQQPLQAIVNYLPAISPYDVLMSHTEIELFIAQTLARLQDEVFEIRQLNMSKPTGIFRQELPVISRCLALKYSQQIFDDLSHYIYDIEVVLRHYQEYYFLAFHETDVAMPFSTNLDETQQIVESLSMQGRFLTDPLPGIADDRITIALYYDGLIQQLDDEKDNSEYRLPDLLRMSSLSEERESIILLNRKAFRSIIKMPHNDRLVVDQTNKPLVRCIAYADQNLYQNIYNSCIEYHYLHKYFVKNFPKKDASSDTHKGVINVENFELPCFVKLYNSKVSTMVHLNRWLMKYENYSVKQIYPDFNLYHFQRHYGEIIEDVQVSFLPSRLCFRDFTVFQLEEFYANLVTPEMVEAARAADTSAEARIQEMLKAHAFEIDPLIFIRPKSLRWRQLDNPSGIALSKNKSSTNGKAKTPYRMLREGSRMLTPRKKSSAAETGLPPGHPLLQGYNLEDIRQEIRTKTTKYYFDDGSLILYEERWCFTNMNKTLTAKFNSDRLFLTRPRMDLPEISPNVRLINRNNVQVRILNTEFECAKVVMNYPNGLSIYHHETHAEQEWIPPLCHNNEAKRVYTPYGAVIIHYREGDLITLLRYNGEVYNLYQYEFPTAEEEEQAWFEEATRPSLSLIEVNDSTTRKSSITIKSRNKDKTQEGSKAKSTEKRKEGGEEKLKNGLEKKRTKSDVGFERSKARLSSKDPLSTSSSSKTEVKGPPPKSKKEQLMDSITYELQFLKAISNKYKLKYMHLVVTTTTGRIVHLTHDGKVYTKKSRPTLEWHDYFVNESYAMRGDGVRMIWTFDKLKCFHEDGTIFLTGLEETYELFEDEDWDRFTLSSSHLNEEEEEIGGGDSSFIKSHPINLNASTIFGEAGSTIRLTKSFKSYSDFLGGEEGKHEDPTFVVYKCDEYIMQHSVYAAVQIIVLSDPINIIHVRVFGVDGIQIEVSREMPHEEMLKSDESVKSESTEKPEEETQTTTEATTSSSSDNPNVPKYEVPKRSMEFESTEYSLNYGVMEDIMTVVKVTMSEDLRISVAENMCFIAIDLNHHKDGAKLRDTLKLRFTFDRNLNDLFAYIMQKISAFKKYQSQAKKEFFFLHRLTPTCNTHGYKFVEKLPEPTQFNFASGNTFTELRALRSISDLMKNEYSWYHKDMKKFPRFKTTRERPRRFELDFPHALTAWIGLCDSCIRFAPNKDVF